MAGEGAGGGKGGAQQDFRELTDPRAAAILAALAQAGGLLAANNLSDVASASTSRTNLGLGTAAVQNVAAFLQAANNLSDLASAGTARTNLGLGTAATAALTALLQASNNLSDLASAATARTNLGLGTAATAALTALAQTANNLSDLASAATARTNLGLGTAATSASTAFAASTDPLGFGITTWLPNGALVTLSNSNVWITANSAAYARLTGSAGAVTKLRLRVATASGNIDGGFYANSGSGLAAAPGTRLGSLGGIACPASGNVDMALTASATANLGDWMAVALDNTTAVLHSAATASTTLTALNGQAGSQTTAYPLPSSATMAQGTVLSRMPFAVGVP